MSNGHIRLVEFHELRLQKFMIAIFYKIHRQGSKKLGCAESMIISKHSVPIPYYAPQAQQYDLRAKQ